MPVPAGIGVKPVAVVAVGPPVRHAHGHGRLPTIAVGRMYVPRAVRREVIVKVVVGTCCGGGAASARARAQAGGRGRSDGLWRNTRHGWRSGLLGLGLRRWLSGRRRCFGEFRVHLGRGIFFGAALPDERRDDLGRKAQIVQVENVVRAQLVSFLRVLDEGQDSLLANAGLDEFDHFVQFGTEVAFGRTDLLQWLSFALGGVGFRRSALAASVLAHRFGRVTPAWWVR